MNIRDPLYGAFELPPVVAALASTPEFRRLSQVRLLNTISPSLATLGELKRYSHTLGVVFLQMQWRAAQRMIYSSAELAAFQAAIVLHDAGTPPFGHLFEYVLRELADWHHERVVPDILVGHHARENVAHQIFAKRTAKASKILKHANVDVDLVQSILRKQHPLSRLILGTIDFDNLDNVARMTWSMGITGGGELAVRLARLLSVDRDGRLLLSHKHISEVRAWLDLRRQAYEILVFDAPTVSAQAVLQKAIRNALEQGLLNLEEWYLTDEELLARLQSDNRTKTLVNELYLGELPKHVLTAQFDDLASSAKALATRDLCDNIEVEARKFGIRNPLAYVFRDRGAFEKRLEFFDPEVGNVWTVGHDSGSVVVYVFSASAQSPSPSVIEDFSRTICSNIAPAHAVPTRLDSAGKNTFVGQAAFDL